MEMISWRMTAPGKALEKTVSPLPIPGEGEVLVRVAGCGVCHTDLGFFYDGVRTKSPPPLTLGHEISGTIEACGPGAESWAGKAVIIPAVLPCGKCDLCTRGKGNICTRQKMPGNDIQGGFATHLAVPAGDLCEVPVEEDFKPKGSSGVTLAELSVLADAITTPYQAIVESGLTDADTAIFIGVGGVGGFGAQIARALGAAVAAIDVDPKKLAAIAPYVDATMNAGEIPAKELRQAIAGFVKERQRRPTEWKIFETSGTSAGQKTAFSLLTYGASLQVVGFTMDTVDIRLSNLMAFHATARGNWGCLPKYYPEVLGLVLSGRVKVTPFVRTYPLDEINEVFERVHHRRADERPILVP